MVPVTISRAKSQAGFDAFWCFATSSAGRCLGLGAWWLLESIAPPKKGILSLPTQYWIILMLIRQSASIGKCSKKIHTHATPNILNSTMEEQVLKFWSNNLTRTKWSMCTSRCHQISQLDLDKNIHFCSKIHPHHSQREDYVIHTTLCSGTLFCIFVLEAIPLKACAALIIWENMGQLDKKKPAWIYVTGKESLPWKVFQTLRYASNQKIVGDIYNF